MGGKQWTAIYGVVAVVVVVPAATVFVVIAVVGGGDGVVVFVFVVDISANCLVLVVCPRFLLMISVLVASSWSFALVLVLAASSLTFARVLRPRVCWAIAIAVPFVPRNSLISPPHSPSPPTPPRTHIPPHSSPSAAVVARLPRNTRPTSRRCSARRSGS